MDDYYTRRANRYSLAAIEARFHAKGLRSGELRQIFVDIAAGYEELAGILRQLAEAQF